MTSVRELSQNETPRVILAPFHNRPLLRSMAILALDYSVLAGLSFLIIWSHVLWIKIIAGILAGVVMGRLFVVGHDACHGSFSRNRRLNRIVGTVAFLPTLTPFKVWDIAHNRTHHVYTNLSTMDYVWAPFSKTAYDALPRWRQYLERIYRTPVGHGLNYFVEIWWKHLFFKRIADAGAGDSILVSVVCAGVALTTAFLGYATDQNVVVLLTCSMAVPFIAWNALMGFIIFQQHTSPDIRWYDDLSAWRGTDSQIDGVQRVLFPRPFNTLFHNIMEHHAHHLDPLISLHELPRAQEALENALGERIRAVPWTLRSFLNAASACKLYDYNTHRWLDFDGTATTNTIA